MNINILSIRGPLAGKFAHYWWLLASRGLSELGLRRIDSLCVRESLGPNRLEPKLKMEFGDALIANESFTLETAKQLLAAGKSDASAFGRLFIPNSDPPERFAIDELLNTPDESTFCRPAPKHITITLITHW
jgi:hypothetical protein